MTEETRRLDQWLFFARFFKTRTLAARSVKAKRFRVNRLPTKKVSQPVRVGDVLTFPYNKEILVVEVLELGDRRGPPAEAQAMYRRIDPETEDV